MGTRATLLCVDDDARCIAIRKLLLQQLGYRVLTSTSGQEALEIFAARSVAGVIVDYQMPDMNGCEVAAAMRQMKPEVPILMLSALPVPPEEADCVVDAYVAKGTPTEVLVSHLDRMLAA